MKKIILILLIIPLIFISCEDDSLSTSSTGLIGYSIASGSESGELLKTTDGGTTWNLATSRRFDSVEFPSNDIGYGIASGSESGELLKTTDGGTTWNLATSRRFDSVEFPRY